MASGNQQADSFVVPAAFVTRVEQALIQLVTAVSNRAQVRINQYEQTESSLVVGFGAKQRDSLWELPRNISFSRSRSGRRNFDLNAPRIDSRRFQPALRKRLVSLVFA